jgi:hypothetical protein
MGDLLIHMRLTYLSIHEGANTSCHQRSPIGPMQLFPMPWLVPIGKSDTNLRHRSEQWVMVAQISNPWGTVPGSIWAE